MTTKHRIVSPRASPHTQKTVPTALLPPLPALPILAVPAREKAEGTARSRVNLGLDDSPAEQDQLLKQRSVLAPWDGVFFHLFLDGKVMESIITAHRLQMSKPRKNEPLGTRAM